ncbi:hypothetical protein FO519_004339 [Halicephalobus sp. NKZ332]|nr:hypothetical protein FO519_004339 [Halicephalobus sp. NKZ332]
MKILFLLFLFPLEIWSHVSFLYPAARYPPLDYLDTSRTLGLCGMPKTENPILTDFVIGMNYKMTWTLGHRSHKGGIRISLLDPLDKKIKQLIPEEDGKWLEDKDDPFSQNLTFSEVCHGCVLQIERQALEYGKSYIFHSCADVNILEAVSDNDDQICSGNGVYKREGNACSCFKGFWGAGCQFKLDCQADSDCGSHGKCVTESHPSNIQKSCFCSFGFFGRNCETEFKSEDPEDMCFNFENLVDTNPPKFASYGLFDPDCYAKKDLNGEDFVYSRIVGEDVEIILDFNTTGWVSIGWRPIGLDPTCRLFPDLGFPKSRRFRQVHGYADSGFLKSAFLSPLHPMDCTDIISATVVDGRSRIQDMYTRDRSTPLRDTYFEGEFSLTAAFGVERDGRTVVMFRRNIREIEPSDHPLGPGKIAGIYGKGMRNEDEFIYHGPRNRGSTIFEFVKKEEMVNNGPLVFLNKGSSPEIPREPAPISDSNNSFLNSGTVELSNEFRAMDPPRQQIETVIENQFSTLPPSSIPPKFISGSSSNELLVTAPENSSDRLQYSIALTLSILVFVFCC